MVDYNKFEIFNEQANNKGLGGDGDRHSK